jgi:hypothetical protein
LRSGSGIPGSRQSGRDPGYDADIAMRGGHQALFGVKQLLQEMQTLAVVVEQVKGDAYAIRGMQLPQIAHVHFGRAAGMSALLDASEPATEQLEHLVHGAVAL